MKIKKPTSIKRRQKIILGIILLVLAGIIFFVIIKNSGLNNKDLTKLNDKTSSVQPEQAKKNSNKDTAEGSNSGASLPQKSSEQNEPPVNQSPDNGSPDVKPEKPVVTRAEQSGDFIRVAAMLQRNSPGYCELRLNKTRYTTLSHNSSIIIGPSYYACGFKIPVSELPAKGRWEAVVIHHAGNATTSSDKKIINVN